MRERERKREGDKWNVRFGDSSNSFESKKHFFLFSRFLTSLTFLFGIKRLGIDTFAIIFYF